MRSKLLIVGMVACALAGGGCKGSSEQGTSKPGEAGASVGDLSGTYTIKSAENPGGKGGYTGSVNIQKAGDIYSIAWTIPGTPPYTGVALAVDSTLGVGWGMGTRYGVAVYRVSGGTLRGQWTTAESRNKIGTEDLEGPPGLNGTYTITSAKGADGKSYTGTVAIAPSGSVYSVKWSVPGSAYSGVGIKEGDLLVVGWGEAGKGAGVVSYQVSGKTLTGKWASPGETQLGSETISKN